MIRLTVLAHGTLSEPYFRSAADTYKERLGSGFREIELKETRLPKSPSETEIRKALEEEADRLIPLIPKKACVIALCVEGREYASEELASLLENLSLRGSSEICFIIGSSYGLSERIKKMADYRISLSRLTLPHQLARVVLFEALYRCTEILKGSKYHK